MFSFVKKVESYSITRFFYLSNTFISNIRLRLAKNLAKAKQHPEAELLTGRKQDEQKKIVPVFMRL